MAGSGLGDRRRRRRAAAAPRRDPAAPPGATFLCSRSRARPSTQTVQDVPHAWCRLGAAAAGLALLRENNVTELVLAGGVRRPSLASLRPDWRAAKFFARIGYRALGDDGLLSAVVGELEREGFRVIGADQLLDQALAPEGPLGKIRPDAQARGRYRARAAHRPGAGRPRYRPGGHRPAGSGARRRGDRRHRRAAAPLRGAAPRRPGRRARQGRKAGPGTAAPTGRRSGRERSRWPRKPGCAGSPSRPARRSCSIATRSSAPPIAPGCLWSASAGRDRGRPTRAVHLYHCRRAVGGCARRRADRGAAAAHRRQAADCRDRRRAHARSRVSTASFRSPIWRLWASPKCCRGRRSILRRVRETVAAIRACAPMPS